ncbi:hypothetical protein F4808DRAFT_247716 [Astrocystis sublimbata]|nr:hypothetical protein F4808DRAFT_247716 [Astrocystis sublimbata]
MEGQERARAYLNTGQLVRHPDPTIGVMQGPIYTSTGLFRAEAHVEEDPTKPLQATFRSQQQDRKPPTRPASFFPSRSGISNATSPDSSERTHELIKKPDDDDDDDNHFHEQQPDLKDILDPGTLLDLRKERAELDDRLIDLDYETSILDSEEDEDDHERHVEN